MKRTTLCLLFLAFSSIALCQTKDELLKKILSEPNYDRNKNEAYFYFDENGVLLKPAPVNVDADDQIIIIILAKKDIEYSVGIKGEYKATDLNIRETQILKFTPETISKNSDYKRLESEFGPYTSDKITICIKQDTNTPTETDVRINKLYNVAFGASFICTDLEKPSFDVFPLAGNNNTINKTNRGSRTLATFNVIYYWKPTVDWVLGNLKNNSNITRGRDVLKEATFWERLNPTFGVAINSEWRENLFFGGNFEFARGGSFTFGWHYGRVQELADKNFILGTTIYNGTKEDIKLSDTWKWGYFFGITLDTRLFNMLISK